MGNNKGRKQEIELGARLYMAKITELLLVHVSFEPDWLDQLSSHKSGKKKKKPCQVATQRLTFLRSRCSCRRISSNWLTFPVRVEGELRWKEILQFQRGCGLILNVQNNPGVAHPKSRRAFFISVDSRPPKVLHGVPGGYYSDIKAPYK